MARPQRVKLTYDDYLHFPESTRWELIDGEALVAPSPNTEHQEIAGDLYWQISSYLRAHAGGRVFVAPYDIVLSDHDVVQPDIVYVAADRDHIITEANIQGTPSWVVEVLSDPHRDRQLKRQIYERSRVPEFWIVDPGQRLLEVYRLSGDEYPDPRILSVPATASPQALPDLEIDLARIFRA